MRRFGESMREMRPAECIDTAEHDSIGFPFQTQTKCGEKERYLNVVTQENQVNLVHGQNQWFQLDSSTS